MGVLNNLVNAKFLDAAKSSGCDALPCFGCDAGPLPPGCDCICHTPCDFGRTKRNYSAKDSKYNSNFADREVYEMS